MAFESVGLGAVLKFDEGKAIAAMTRSSRAFRQLQMVAGRASLVIGRAGASMRGIGRGAMMMARGVSTAATAMLPLAAATAFAGKQAADFEQAIANVGAVMLKAPSQMGGIIAKAKELGATTKFSASESALAMENLARAGFESEEIISSIGGVMSAAAADGLDLASAANIVAGAIRGMGLETSKAAGVSNVLAFVSSKTRTNIAALGQNLKFTMAQAKVMNIGFAQLTASLGVAADSLGSSTAGGTSLTQMLVKMAKPTSEGAKLFKQLGFQAKFTKDGQLDLAASIATISTKIKNISDPLKRARVQTELFGIRGQKAFSALAGALPKLSKLTGAAAKQFGMLSGAAAEMAAIRMKTLRGGLTLLKSALEGLSIEVMSPLLSIFSSWVKVASKGIGDVVRGLIALNSKGGEMSKGFQSLSPVVQAVVRGIKGALDDIKRSATALNQKLLEVRERFGGMLTPKTIESLTKFATRAVVLAPLIAGAGIAMKAFGFIMSSAVVPVVSGLFIALKGIATLMAGPIGLAIGAAVVGFLLFKKQIFEFARGVRKTLAPAFGVVKQAWMKIVGTLIGAWNTLKSEIQKTMGTLSINWVSLGRKVGTVLLAILIGVTTVTVKVVAFGVKVFTIAVKIEGWIIRHVVGAFRKVRTWVIDVGTVVVAFGATAVRVFIAIVNKLKPVLKVLGEVFFKIDSIITLTKTWASITATAAKKMGTAIEEKYGTPLREAFGWLSALIEGFGGLRGIALTTLSAIKRGIDFLLIKPLRDLALLLVTVAEGLDVRVPSALKRFAAGMAKVGVGAAAAGVRVPGAGPTVRAPRGREGLAPGAARFAAQRARKNAEAAGRAAGRAAGEAAGRTVGEGLNKMADAVSKQPCVETTVDIDGKEVAKANSKVAAEASERGAWKATPWQQRMALEQGAMVPVR